MARLWPLLLLLTVVIAPLTALAGPGGDAARGDRDAARALATAGFRLYDQGDYEQAIKRFANAEAIHHAPPHLLYMARANAKLGRLVEARRLYERLVAEDLGESPPQPFRDAKQDAAAELLELNKRIPSVNVTVVGDDASNALVTIDGELIASDALAAPVPLDPGQHLVEARAPGRPKATANITLREGSEVTDVRLTVEAGTAVSVEEPQSADGEPAPDEGDQGGPSLVGPAVLMAAGGAVLVVGAVTGGLALSNASELKDKCPQSPCSDEHEHLQESVNTLGTVSTVAFVVGGAAMAGGLLWWLLLPSEPGASDDVAAVRVAPYAGPYGWGVQGSF